jgi:hypothetical protein
VLFRSFLDQTIDDALGPEQGTRLRFVAAREASHAFLRGLCVRKGAVTPAEKLQAAAEAFAAMGHGRINISADANGGTAVGEFLHYGFAWHQKYWHRVRRRTPADAFAAGFIAAATEVAFGLDAEALDAKETNCLAMKAERCSFELTQATTAPLPVTPVREAEVQARVKPSFQGKEEATIAGIAKGLRDFTAGVAGDERGLVQAFGVFVTMHLAGYYNRISYDAVGAIEKIAPQSVPVLEELLRESGHVCVFNTFGGILRSPEWESMVGPLTGDPLQSVTGCLAIARALGFGHWTLEDYTPLKRVVLRAPSSYESVYYATRHGTAKRPNEYFLQGAAIAIAQLAHRVKWAEKPQLTQEFYDALFRGGSLPCRMEQTASSVMGHAYSEVVVTKLE